MEMENNLVVTKIEIYFIRTPKTIVNVLGSFVMFINLTEINYGFMIKYQNKKCISYFIGGRTRNSDKFLLLFLNC